MAPKKPPSHARMLQLEKAFLDHGYAELSMRGLAKACDCTTRALYHYFSSKEEVFRATVRFRNELALGACFVAARSCWAKGGGALDIVSALIDTRYGDLRRLANASQHVVELSGEVFKRCYDIVTEVAQRFESDLAKLLRELADAGLLRLRTGVAVEQLAQALANGARGVNQRLPPVAPAALEEAYKDICRFVLFGGAQIAAIGKSASSARQERIIKSASLE
jgi:AcrR family transcriptional regulator